MTVTELKERASRLGWHRRDWWWLGLLATATMWLLLLARIGLWLTLYDLADQAWPGWWSGLTWPSFAFELGLGLIGVVLLPLVAWLVATGAEAAFVAFAVSDGSVLVPAMLVRVVLSAAWTLAWWQWSPATGAGDA